LRTNRFLVEFESVTALISTVSVSPPLFQNVSQHCLQIRLRQ